ncbi:MAG: GNAT family N-acetyltransferase [Firmicutes bacterium]|nr:GNAT family N-acetyltransferase [Bacillota bacterium]
MEIRELISEAEWRQAYPIMKELRTHLDESGFVEMVKVMQGEGYRLFALETEGEVVAVAGVAIRMNLYYGRHCFVYDLVTRSDLRSRGYGEELLSFLHEWGRQRDCRLVALTSNLTRQDAHRFYEEKMDYRRVSYVFRKDL